MDKRSNENDLVQSALNHWLDSHPDFGIEDLLPFPWMNRRLAEEEIEFMLQEGLIEKAGERYTKKAHKACKLIFLDVDGVLNSACGGSFKDGCLQNLKRIVDSVGAKIILVSSWKSGWEKKEKHFQDEYGDYLDKTLMDYGIEIFNKSSRYSGGRTADVLDWVLRANADGFVVLDDEPALYRHPAIISHCVFTSFSRGLTTEDANKAIVVLGGELDYLKNYNNDDIDLAV